MVRDYFAELPEGLGVDQIREEVRKLLARACTADECSPLEVADGLYELSDRQSATYLPFDDDTRREIQGWVNSVWTEESLALLDILASVVVGLGLVEGQELLEGAAKSSDARVRAIAEDALKEISIW